MQPDYKISLSFATTLAFCLTYAATASAVYAQQKFIQTVNSGNISCNATCSVIEVPALYENPDAIVFVSQVNSNRNNPHPIGAYYMYLKRWAIHNLDGVAIVDGAQFKVEYYLNSAPDHFVYVVPNEGRACIERAGLDGNPNAKIRLFPTSSPRRGALYNKGNVKVGYKAENQKWCLANPDGGAVTPETAFNIAFTSGSGAIPLTGTPTNLSPVSVVQAATASVPAGTMPLQGNPVVPVATLAPGQQAPLTVVARVEWSVPTVGNVGLAPEYCKVISPAYTNPAILATDTVIVTGQSTDEEQNLPSPVPTNQGKNLRWSATVDNGSIQLTACNSLWHTIVSGNQQTSSYVSGMVYLNGRKVNILVLR